MAARVLTILLVSPTVCQGAPRGEEQLGRGGGGQGRVRHTAEEMRSMILGDRGPMPQLESQACVGGSGSGSGSLPTLLHIQGSS